MKIYTIILTLLMSLFFTGASATGATVEEEIDRVAGEVAKLELGFGDYVLGKPLSESQKAAATQNPIQKSLQGTYKFLDDGIYVIAANDNDIVLGVYKDYPDTSMEEIKKMVGNLMFEYGEPTTSAHDKMIYWTYDANGKIGQDTFDLSKESGGAKSLATIKFSSSEMFSAELKDKDAPISAYLMITSNPLSKLFLAKNQQ